MELDMQDGSVVLKNGHLAVFTLPGVQMQSNAAGFTVSKYNPIPERQVNKHKWAKWGDDNLFPQNVKTETRKVGVMMSGLKLRRDLHYGKGIITFKEEISEGRIQRVPAKFPEWEQFEKISRFERFMLQIISDYTRLGNYFAEIIFDKAGKKIAAVRRLDPHFCRWELMNENSLRIENLYYSKRWPIPKEEEYVKIPALDIDFPLWDLQSRMMLGKVKPGASFILPIRLQEDGNTYYEETYWNGIRNTWLPIASNVPAMKLAIMRNQMTLKYHIKIPYEYWTWMFRDEWDSWDAKTRTNKISSTLDDMNEFLTDVENTGKAFISHYSTDLNTGKAIGEWTIEAIDNKLKNDAYLPDSQAANSEILFALGIDPTIIGQSSPGGSKDGSGSNKREAFTIAQALLTPDRQQTLAVAEFIRDFNGWPEEMQFGHRDLDVSETLDKNPTGRKEVMN